MNCCCSCGPLYVGTTPKHTFTFPIEAQEIKELLVTYAQDDEIILEKRIEDLAFDEYEIKGNPYCDAWFRLTQEETNLFDPSKGKYCVQIRAMSQEGQVVAGEKHFYSVASVLNAEVLTNE